MKNTVLNYLTPQAPYYEFYTREKKRYSDTIYVKRKNIAVSYNPNKQEIEELNKARDLILQFANSIEWSTHSKDKSLKFIRSAEINIKEAFEKLPKTILNNSKGISSKELSRAGYFKNRRLSFNSNLYCDTETHWNNLNVTDWELLQTSNEINKFLKERGDSVPWIVTYVDRKALKLIHKELIRSTDRTSIELAAKRLGLPLDILDKLNDKQSIADPRVEKLLVELLWPSVNYSIDPTGAHSDFVKGILLNEDLKPRLIMHNAKYDLHQFHRAFILNGYETRLEYIKAGGCTLEGSEALHIYKNKSLIHSLPTHDTLRFNRQRLSDDSYKEEVPYDLANVEIVGDLIRYYSYNDKTYKTFPLSIYIRYACKDVVQLYMLELKHSLLIDELGKVLGLDSLLMKNDGSTKPALAHHIYRVLVFLGITEEGKAKLNLSNFPSLDALKQRATAKAKNQFDIYLIGIINKNKDNPDEERARRTIFRTLIRVLIKNHDNPEIENWLKSFFGLFGQTPNEHTHKYFFHDWLRPNLTLYPEDFFPQDVEPLELKGRLRIAKNASMATGKHEIKRRRYECLYSANAGGFTFHNVDFAKGYQCDTSNELIHSYDINSSYPFQMLRGLPAGIPSREPKPEWVNPCVVYRIQTTPGFIEWTEKYKFLGQLVFEVGDDEVENSKELVRSRLPLSASQEANGLVGGCYLHKEFYDLLKDMMPPGAIRILDRWYFERCVAHVPLVKNLFKLRRAYKGTFADQGLKICINSEYGKLGQKAYHTTAAYWDRAALYLDNEVDQYYSTIAASYITQLGQVQLLKAVKNLIAAGFKVLGGDTDSIKVVVPHTQINKISKVIDIGDELGQWKKEAEYSALYYNADVKKKYYLVPANIEEGDFELKFSGIDSRYADSLKKVRDPEFIKDLITLNKNALFKQAKNRPLIAENGSYILVSTDVSLNPKAPIDWVISLSTNRQVINVHSPEGELIKSYSIS